MAALPVDNTQRFFLDYSTSLLSHTMMVRTTSATSAAAFSTFMNDFLTALAPELSVLTVDGARVAQVNSNVSIPITWSGAATYGTGSESAINRPRQLCFLGRTVNGRRARLFVYGGDFTMPNDYRIDRAANATIDAAYDVLELNPQFFAAIDGLATVKYNYVDVNFNSYWERKVR